MRKNNYLCVCEYEEEGEMSRKNSFTAILDYFCRDILTVNVLQKYFLLLNFNSKCTKKYFFTAKIIILLQSRIAGLQLSAGMKQRYKYN